MAENSAHPTSNAEAFLQAMHSRGVEYVFANAGTDFAPVIEALVRQSEKGIAVPRFVTVPHENVAISMAQGYYLMTGKPAGVMVHVTVGTANALCGLMNAARDNIPVLMMAGRTPATETGNIGSRNVSIHWGQESFDQGGIVREFVKWDYELRAGQPVDSIVGRALDIAMSEPRGPVYLALPREVLGGAAVENGGTVRDRPLGNLAPVPSAASLDRAARLIAQAQNPLIVTGKVGNRPGAFEALGELAAEFALPVVQVREPSLPSSHPMNLGYGLGDPFKNADLILVVECPVPWLPRVHTPREDAVFIHLSADPFFSAYPFRGFEMDLALAGEPVETLRLLRPALQAHQEGRQGAIAERAKVVEENHDQHTASVAKTLEQAGQKNIITPPWVAACINRVKGPDAIIVSELGVNAEHLEHHRPTSFISGAQAGGLGMGLGQALGAKLAAPERDVILIVGDGSYMFGVPTAAHFVGAAEDLPTLTVVMNNSQWFAVHRATTSMYPEGQAIKAGKMPLVDLSPGPDFVKTIESCGGYGERVDTVENLEPALRRCLEKVRGGTSALLNVITQPGGR